MNVTSMGFITVGRAVILIATESRIPLGSATQNPAPCVPRQGHTCNLTTSVKQSLLDATGIDVYSH